MNVMRYLWCGISAGLLGCLPCRGAGEGKTEKRVDIVFTEASLQRIRENDGEEGTLQWKCRAVLFIREPWMLESYSVVENQSLGMRDEDGSELPPVEFDLRWLSINKRKGMSFTYINGTMAKVLPDCCAWMRMKGCLRIPVVRLLESPVYELSLRQGASCLIPWPGSGEFNAGNVGDVVELDELPMGTLYVRRCEWKMISGEKRLALSIGLDAPRLFDPETFQILDGKGKVMDAANPSDSNSDDPCGNWTAEFTFSPPEKMDQDKCRIRLIYKTEPEYVTVPVDARFGIGGEIREKPEKRKGKGAR